MECGKGGLPMLRIKNELAECDIYLQGAHIARFQPVGRSDHLWMSPYSRYEKGSPLRGGIPLCFPWFGKHPERPDLPLHGFVRTREWNFHGIDMLADGSSSARFSIEEDPETLAVWPYKFRLELTAKVGARLELTLVIQNTGNLPFTCEEGFHTYFPVSHPSRCEVFGFDGLSYIDRVRQDSRHTHVGSARYVGETVNAYMAVPGEFRLLDSGSGAGVVIEQTGLESTVIWNPGSEAGAANPEIKDAWDSFVCVESTNCLERRLAIEPGAYHSGTVRYTFSH